MSNQDDKYWFGRKKYGYGWVPINKYGWFVLLGYSFLIMLGAWLILKDAPDDDFAKEAITFFAYSAGMFVVLIWVCFKKGPRPRLQRGGKPIRKKKKES